eukprot:TRINITY_DN1973_c0_g4_i1.p1 TRINITY_DN1973_c0_g4~~TRINITY_DN1973_c0_g4_i1.p1  ORF type:complete len:749 (+),score=176.38 TRINITY_DN1973_c0_g4_i1:99-2345(+)
MVADVTLRDLSDVPNLPGYSIQELKDRYHKPQTWNCVNGQRIEQKEGLSHERPKFVKAARAADPWRKGSLPDSTSRALLKTAAKQTEHCELPAWDAFDRHVLRYYGFFKESVVESNLENYRVRKVVILYYLEDDTCQILEPRQDNSGIPQGTFVRRHRFPAPKGYLKPEDIRVGEDISCYGRLIRVYDCDPFTREYYDQIGAPQDGPCDVEGDTFNMTQEALKKTNPCPPRTYEKIYREVMLGGGHINADMQQFLEMDKKVLRFFAIMDDLSTPQFERRPFIILFFLQDDQVEIREQYPLNCGRDNFPIFFRKNKMLAGPVVLDGPQSQPRKKAEYVHGHDLYVGQHVTLSGYNFFIYDADEFTRQYFRDVLSRELEPPKEVQLPDRAVPRAKTPPYTGYGSWDDSMGSVLHLIPKPPKKDYNKLFYHEGKIMRFTARFAKPKPEDVDRLFVINYYLADDTMCIHEPPQRNLGIVTGKFLDKNVHLNQLTGDIFRIEDFTSGNRIKVLNHEFEIIDCDEYTRKLLADPNQRHTSMDLVTILEKMRESMRQQFPLVRDIFRRFDTDHDSVITKDEFKKGCEKFGFLLSDEEVITILKHFDARQDGQVSYNEFCDVLLDEDYTTSMLKTKPNMDLDYDASYHERAASKVEERAETEAVRKAVRELGDAVYKKSEFFPRLMKEFSHLTHLSVVNCEQIQWALLQLGQSFTLQDVQRAAVFVMGPDADLQAIPYIGFFRSLQNAYHDLAHIR